MSESAGQQLTLLDRASALRQTPSLPLTLDLTSTGPSASSELGSTRYQARDEGDIAREAIQFGVPADELRGTDGTDDQRAGKSEHEAAMALATGRHRLSA
jgi:hypothetical protein